MRFVPDHTTERFLCYYIFLNFLIVYLLRMNSMKNWDWNAGEKCLADIGSWEKSYPIVQELVVSNDGEKIAAVVEIEKNTVVPCINNTLWEEPYEKVWSLKFTPEGRLACSVLRNYEWTVAVDGIPWEETYDFLWNMTFSGDGKTIAGNIKKDNEHSVQLMGSRGIRDLLR